MVSNMFILYWNTLMLLKSKALIACSLGLSVIAFSYTPISLAQKITGKVVDLQGNVVTLARVNIHGTDQVVVTDEQGSFVFTKLTSGNFELHVRAKNYAHNNQYITLKEDDISDIVIQLSPSVMEFIDVYATPLHSSTIESSLPVNVISGDDLKLKQASTLGETLKNEVGVHSSFYGSVASSPIIRGLDGPRVLIMQNGLDAGDASRVGADHAVSTETSTATQIEVLRGPATLFYGNGAIGGVVNVVDNRVPTSSDTLAEWLLQYNDVSDEKQASLSLQNGLAIGNQNFAVHVDGFWREASDYKLPKGFDANIDEDEGEDHEDEHEEEHEKENSRHLANSYSTSKGFTLGSSYLFDQGFIGFSYGKINRDYGIPGHTHHEEESPTEHEDHIEGTKAEMQQDRLQLLSEIKFDHNIIKQLAVKFAYTDYQHQEIENGLVGTTFTNKSVEMKTDLFHQDVMNWQGAWTFHFKRSDFKALGEEAFAPPSKTDSFAIAWLEEKHFGQVLLQLGARVEQVRIDAEDSIIVSSNYEQGNATVDSQKSVSFEQQKYNPLSTSVGAVWDYQPGYNLGLSVAFSQRAPTAAELFSFGPHIGTSTFEVGAMFDLSLENDGTRVVLSSQTPELETSYSIDLTWRKFEGDFGFVVSAFYNQVEDYYYQQNTGILSADEHEDGLPILVYQQADVDMYGAEAKFVYQINSSLKGILFGDYIHAKLSNGNYLPRTPPMRIGSLLNYQGNNYDSEFSVNHYLKQNNIASLETPTAAYTLVDMNFNYYLNDIGLDGLASDIVLYVKGQNLMDETALVHSSFLKNVAPLPGRNFSVGIRGSF